MNFLLTGHEGYVGSRLMGFLQENDHRVMGWGRQQDILRLTRDVIEDNQIEAVIHCATVMDRVSTRYVVDGADEKVNVLGTQQVVRSLQGTNASLIHISTKDVYGPVYQPGDVVEEKTRYAPSFEIDDDQRFSPQTIYGKTKLMGEFIAEAHPRTNIVRLSSCYTSDVHRRGNWVLNICRAARDGKSVTLSGGGKQLRDLLHADDLGALILSMVAKNEWGLVMNAGGGSANAYSIVEVLDQIDPAATRSVTPGDDLGFVASNRVAREKFQWAPKRDFRIELPLLLERVRTEEKNE